LTERFVSYLRSLLDAFRKKESKPIQRHQYRLSTLEHFFCLHIYIVWFSFRLDIWNKLNRGNESRKCTCGFYNLSAADREAPWFTICHGYPSVAHLEPVGFEQLWQNSDTSERDWKFAHEQETWS
jgi:hypothetical protein